MFQFRRFPTHTYVFSMRYTVMSPCRFPHSDSHGSKLICSSPWIFAACRVLLRLPMPRHSPCALFSLNFMRTQIFNVQSVCVFTLSIFQLPLARCSFLPYALRIFVFSICFFSFCVLFSFQGTSGGLKWARTTDLALIRRAL